MNILYISSKKRWGGVFSWMEKTAIALQERGHKVWILSHPASRYNQSASKKVNIISKKLGIEYSPLSILFLVYLIKKKKIDLVVTNIEKEIGIGGVAAKICGIPNIRRVGSEVDFIKRFKTRWNHEHLVTKSMVPCDDIKNKALQRAPWLKENSFITIYNGRDPKKFTEKEIAGQREEWGVTAKDLVIGITSQLTKVKRIDILIRAFKKLLSTFPSVYLVISGEGQELENLESLANSLNIKNRVIFSGFTANPLLAAAAYDVASLVSRREGFPNSIVEYFAVGRPVIATNVGGVPELIEHNYNGLLIPEGDEAALINALKRLLSDKDLREELSRNSLTTLKKEFTEKQMIDKLEAFYKDVSGIN